MALRGARLELTARLERMDRDFAPVTGFIDKIAAGEDIIGNARSWRRLR